MSASSTAPPAPTTGYVHEHCYAAALHDCSSRITREHYVSRVLLNLMGGTVDVAGLSFQQPGTIRGLGEKSLTAKVLCERHNRALAALDSEAGRLFDALRGFDQGLRDGQTPVSEERVVNGADVERWFLKVLAGLARGGLLSSAQLRPESGWLEILFGGPWPTGWGLYLLTDPTTRAHAFDGVEINTLTHEDAVWGAVVDVAGFSFQLALGRPGNSDQLLWRPAGLELRRPGAEGTKRLTFGWPQQPGAGYVSFTRGGQYDGPRPQDSGLRRV
jgi:hypothetical protein